MIERHPIASYAHGCYVTSMSKNLGSYRVILTEEDIRGASLQKRKPENLKNEELRCRLKCRGGSVCGNRVQLLER